MPNQKWEYLSVSVKWTKEYLGAGAELKSLLGKSKAFVEYWEWTDGSHSVTLTDGLNQYGLQGWELVSQTVASYSTGWKYPNQTDHAATITGIFPEGYSFVFKRALP